MNASEQSAYAELHAISNFSFLRGASHPEELVDRAHALGYGALALTDECSVAGCVRAHLQAKGCGLKLIVGSEFVLADGLRIVLLAPDRAAYGDLSELITHGRRNAKKGAYHLVRADVAALGGRCLALWLPGEVPDAGEIEWLRKVFADRLWIAVELLRSGYDRARLAQLRAFRERFGVPCVAAGGVQMHERSRKRLHDVLTAIRLGTTVQAAGHALLPNGERRLRPLAVLARIYPPELLEESTRIAERCTFSLADLRYEYPDEIVPTGETPTRYLRRLTEEGMRERWPNQEPPQKVRDLVERELALIAELKYEAFFLTVYDVVGFAKKNRIYRQGRGSAANSAVCFCLGITEVDPDKSELLFERFISKERNEPPDIDVDFEHERREEVIQYVYNKYGRHRAALAATLITYRTRSAVRDVGKALGFSFEQVDRLAKNFQWWDEGIDEKEQAPDKNQARMQTRKIVRRRIREAGFDSDNPRLMQLVQMVRAIRGFPRHLSQHVGGFVIARDSLARLVPIENAAMPDRTVIQWDKDDIDALGLLKVDCLGLGMLTVIRKAFGFIEAWDGRKLTIADIVSDEDPNVYEMISNADTIGVFQIESRAQMSMLPRLKPERFYELVIEIAIVRPGPIQGNMVHPYLRRRAGLEPISYPSPDVAAVLQRTLGVPIFQEQVIKLAMVAAGFGGGEADGLRRAMASWRRKGGLERYEEKLIDGMRNKGYSEQFARQIFEQIKGFGEYGFPESHSASFALLAYVSAWLKHYEPAIFLAALLNSQPMGFYAPAQLIQDARRHSVEVRPIDVRYSDWDCTLERCGGGTAASRSDKTNVASYIASVGQRPAVRLGLRHVKGLSQAGAGRLMQARRERAFADVADLVRRAALDRRDREALAAAGTLKGLAGHRHRARWAVAGVEPARPLLANVSIPEAIPLLRVPTPLQDVTADYAQLGFTLGPHPFTFLRKQLAARGYLSAKDIEQLPQGRAARAAGIVVGRQHPGSAKGVIFLTLEDETGDVNVVVWPKLVERYRRVVTQARLIFVDGEVQREGKVIHVVARRLQDRTRLLGGVSTRSRDFH